MARFRKKKAPGLHTSLRKPPESQPSPVIRPPKKTTTGKLQHQRQNPQQYRYRPYLYPSGPITTAKKGPTTAQPETSFCPTNQPRNMSFSNAYLIFDKLITRRTHISNLPIELYSDSTSSSTPRTLSSATRESLQPQFYLLGVGWDVSAAAAALLKPSRKRRKAARQPRRQTRRGNFPIEKKKKNNNNTTSQ